MQIQKLRTDNVETIQEIHKKYESSLRQKDEYLRSTLNEVELLKTQITKLKTEAMERKADEEIRLNEKLKELS